MSRKSKLYLLLVASWSVVYFAVCQQVCPAQEKPWSASVLTDVRTSMVEGRLGRAIDETWSAGLLATWFEEEAREPHEDWGVGAWVRATVDPDATIPLREWFPWVGDWVGLPETIEARTYLIGKVQALPYEGGVDLQGSAGAGAQVGPVVVEWVYALVESGDADNPALSSGATLWLGLRLEF